MLPFFSVYLPFLPLSSIVGAMRLCCKEPGLVNIPSPSRSIVVAYNVRCIGVNGHEMQNNCGKNRPKVLH